MTRKGRRHENGRTDAFAPVAAEQESACVSLPGTAAVRIIDDATDFDLYEADPDGGATSELREREPRGVPECPREGMPGNRSEPKRPGNP